MTPLAWLKIIGGALVLVVAFTLTTKIKNHFERFAELEASEAANKVETKTNEAGVESLDRNLTEQKEFADNVDNRLANVERKTEKLRHENKNVDRWLTGVIPIELRDTAREAETPISNNSIGRESDPSALQRKDGGNSTETKPSGY